ncbi:unnamed protein product [Phytophthora lilii]|uniref:Unnamed protein product n=1 Tax=Phytophthora lilii TaxID=2077276 RepID=A0A9W6TNV1_9STRA|nr:unnamed protein product [Phytophthora lilii]
MRATSMDGGAGELHALQEELKTLGISVVSGRQDTVISVKIKGLAGRALVRGLKLADQLLQEKIKHTLKACTDPATKLFTDPTFGPGSNDPDGAAAICKAGGVISSKGGSQHQAKVLGLLQRGKIRWERPISPQEKDNQDDIYAMSASDNVFASNATLFADGVSSGDVIQGNLGDCWFLIFGFTDKKAGKPYFARCRNPNELWYVVQWTGELRSTLIFSLPGDHDRVSLLEKAYAKLHGSYEALIGGFVDCALNDLTGMCSEQVILREGFPGFGENPFAPARPQQKHGDPFWEKIIRYKESGTLMGCSIQPPVTSSKDVAVESSAGNGLYFKHAYALVDAAEIKTTKGDSVRLVKLRNPWGPWSDSSEERAGNEDAIEKFFKIMRRKVGANAEKRVFMTLNAQGLVGADEISQEEIIEINANDGTFFMSYDAWMQSFTHFFAGIEGSWNEANCGGNTTKSTWINNPHFELILEQRARIFASLSQEDPRGSENLKIVPVGFHICSLSPVGNDTGKFEIKEPIKKLDAYYRLYKPADRESFQTGKRPEHLPPAIIPGTVIPGIDDDGVPQPAYTFKQAVSVSQNTFLVMTNNMLKTLLCRLKLRWNLVDIALFLAFCQQDKVTGNTNVGSFWISVYSDKPSFRLEGGEKIVEEEEGDEEAQGIGTSCRRNSSVGDRRLSSISSSKNSDKVAPNGSTLAADKRRKYENEKEELLRQAKRYGIGLRELRAEFAKTPKLQKAECRHKLQKLGFSVASWDDEKLVLLFGEADSSVIHAEKILKILSPDIQEEKMACELPDMEEDGDTTNDIHREGILEIELSGAGGLVGTKKRQRLTQRKVKILAPEFSPSQCALRRRIASEILERDPSMAWHLRHFARKSALLASSRYASLQIGRDTITHPTLLSSSVVANFYDLVEKEYSARLLFRADKQEEAEFSLPISRTPVYTKRDQMSPLLSAISPKGFSSMILNSPSSNAVDMHKTNRIRDLESRRSAKLAMLLQQKQQALGDAEKTLALPRLIGGRKSGSSLIKCCDCGGTVPVSGRGDLLSTAIGNYSSNLCSGVNCVNVFCGPCYSLLPAKSKVCEECFQHEVSPEEMFGEQLRVILIEKIGASDQQRVHLEEVFSSFDTDGSGSLSHTEFEKMLQILNIQPALTQGQKTFLIDQFDANGDGEISLTEFRHWILRDHIWGEPPSVASTEPEATAQIAGELLATVIAPICNEIVDLAFNAYAFSLTVGSWSKSINSTSETQTTEAMRGETGDIIFQRVASFDIGSSTAVNAADNILEQVDGDGSGSIDQFEFVELLSALGIHLSTQDTILLMNCLGASATGYDRITIERSAFISYVELMTSKHIALPIDGQIGSLSEILVHLDRLAGSGPNIRQALQHELQQLHVNMSKKDLIMVCKALEDKAGIDIVVADLKSLAMNLSFDCTVSLPDASGGEGADKLMAIKSSGDILAKMLLAESSELMKYVKDFDDASICSQLSSHLQKRSGTNSTKRIWKSVFGVDTGEVLYLSDFLAGILRTGFLITRETDLAKLYDAQRDQFIAQLLLSLVADKVRVSYRAQLPTSSGNPVISFNMFRMIMRLQKVKEIELKFNHALKNFLQCCQGKQQLSVTIALDATRNLIIRTRDPIYKFSADLILREDEFDYQNLVDQLISNDFERRFQQPHEVSRELTFSKSPHGLITDDCYPELNKSMLSLLGRIRVDFRRRSPTTSYHNSRFNVITISLVESDTFVATLRNLLAQIELPFFWAVSPRQLVFSIENEYLEQQGKSSFQQLVAETLSLHESHSSQSLRALATFVLHTASSLMVRYEVIGKHTNVESRWQEFQDFIAGHQNAYAVIQLHPQGSVFSTCVARTNGAGAVRWNFKTQIQIEEPKVCDRRIDRPVVFTDTVKISRIPGGTPTAESTKFIVTDDGSSGHFVVVNVRRALPSGPESIKPRLYCTAYDPLTSCDYAVEGYPLDWSVDFFDVTVNPSFESQWHEMLSTMHLGETITPKLAITVFNKQPKTDKLIGECEVSVGSAIVLEGHIFEERIAVHSPAQLSMPCVACVATLSFRFDVKKVLAPQEDSLTKTKRHSQQATPAPVPIKFGAQYLAGEIVTPRLELVKDNEDDRLKELQASIVSIEQSKLEAQEQVRQLKAQIQQLSSASNKTSEDAAERWKRRLEQAKQEHFASEEDFATRLATLQNRVRLLTEENEKQKSTLREASNLKDCGLTAEASAHDILSSMRAILMRRCPERPYNGLKKALAAEAEVPGKVVFLVDEAYTTLTDVFVSLANTHLVDFFIKLCGDAEAYEKVRTPRPQSPAPEPSSPVDEDPVPVVFTVKKNLMPTNTNYFADSQLLFFYSN